MKNVDSYYDFADSSYYTLKRMLDAGIFENDCCVLANSIVERYLKHVITVLYDVNNDEDFGRKAVILKSHSLKGLCGFINHNKLMSELNHDIINQADGYHRSARYPGDDAIFVTNDDVNSAWQAVEYCKQAVDNALTKKD